MSAKKRKQAVSQDPRRKVKSQVIDSVSSEETGNTLVISYLLLRKTVGIIGIALPFVLYLGEKILFHVGIQDSISAYYHTGMRDVFVGALWVIGLFLYSYKGYKGTEEDKKHITGILTDDVAGNLTCIFAIGVSLFPTWSSEVSSPTDRNISGYMHLIFAALFFLTLSYFSIFLFTKTQKDSIIPKGSRKMQRNIWTQILLNPDTHSS